MFLLSWMFFYLYKRLASDFSNLFVLNSNLQPLVYGIGKRIPENADLNDYTEPGVYYSQNVALTNTLKNVPDGVAAGFRLEVKTVSATG